MLAFCLAVLVLSSWEDTVQSSPGDAEDSINQINHPITETIGAVNTGVQNNDYHTYNAADEDDDLTAIESLLYAGVAAKELSEILRSNSSYTLQSDAIAAAVIEVLRHQSQDFVDIEGVEMFNAREGQYACASRGTLRGLRSVMLHSIYRMEDETGDWWDHHITLTFSDLRFHFLTFYHKISPWYSFRGQLEVHYVEPAVLLSVRVAKPARLQQQYESKECILHVKKFMVRYLFYQSVNIATAGVYRKLFTAGKVKSLVWEHRQLLIKRMESKVKRVFLNALANGGNWICPGMPANEETEERLEFTNSFNDNCHKP